jgi:uncharacterized protein (TIGR03118 family)
MDSDPSPVALELKHLLADAAQKFLHVALGAPGMQHARTTFTQTNLVGDNAQGFPQGMVTDPNLINPWGVSFSPTSPFWVSDNGTGVATLFPVQDLNGINQPQANPLVVTIATPPGQMAGSASPTGQVFNTDTDDFTISKNGITQPSIFLFATEDGTISGWNPKVDPTNSILAVDNSNNPAEGADGNGAVYKGLAIGKDGGPTLLFAANFRHGTVDVFDGSVGPDGKFNQVNSLTDPSIPAGYAPFNVQVLDGHLFVTYAKQDDAKHDDVAGQGNGFVDEFDLNGNLLHRVASHGQLDSPWGLAIAPSDFGKFAGDLLVGNFGDGTINAYDLKNDHFVGKLLGSDGKPITIGDLWALTPGNGHGAGDPGTIYFTAGVQDEKHGLFGSLTPNTGGDNSVVSMPSSHY